MFQFISEKFNFLMMDQWTIGLVTWGSGIITTFGFGIAIWQLKKIKMAAEAASTAAEAMSKNERHREYSIRLSNSASHLKETTRLMSGDINQIATCAYLDTTRVMLTEAQQLIPDAEDTPHIQEALLQVQKTDEYMQENSTSLDAEQIAKRLRLLRKSLVKIEQMAAAARYRN